jgi:hypothetical protein
MAWSRSAAANRIGRDAGRTAIHSSRAPSIHGGRPTRSTPSWARVVAERKVRAEHAEIVLADLRATRLTVKDCPLAVRAEGRPPVAPLSRVKTGWLRSVSTGGQWFTPRITWIAESVARVDRIRGGALRHYRRARLTVSGDGMVRPALAGAGRSDRGGRLAS